LEGRVAYAMLGVLVAVFLAEHMVLASQGEAAFRRAFVLEADFAEKPWTVVTSIFAHDPFNFSHILLNGLVLFFFGPLLEGRIGSRRFLLLFLVGGAIAGLAQVTLYAAFLHQESGVVGASGALMSVMGALTVLAPRLTVLVFFVIPAPLWALTMVYAAIDVLGLMAATGSIAHMAHLGGLAFGLAMGKRMRDQGYRFPGPAGHVTAPRSW
ncbi:MAG: rhomboid family intramembrane serine protease, partial [bacterium]